MHVIGTAGHVDHGKSTLVHRLTGMDPDRFAEEKRRGLTIDLGFAWFELPSGVEIGMVDVPGHERFIKNMLAGAGGITVCLLVVAANEGWMPQTAEHLAAIEVLGISSGVIAITKSDLAEPDEIENLRDGLRSRLANTTLSGSEIVACSGTTGAGIDELIAALSNAIESTPGPPDLGRPRLWIDRAFTIAGAGTVVTGTLAGGSFSTGDSVEVIGAEVNAPARIRSLQSHKRDVDRVGPGQRVAMNLSGLGRAAVARGDAVVLPGSWQTTDLAHARIVLPSEQITGRRYTLGTKGSHTLHAGSAETRVDIALVGTEEIEAGEVGFAVLHLQDALPLERGDRFVLRDAGRAATIGGGEVLDPTPGARLARTRDSSRSYLEGLAGARGGAVIDVLVEHLGSVSRADARRRAATTEEPDASITLGDDYISRARLTELGTRLRETLQRHHAEHPLEPGLSKEVARAKLGLDAAAFTALAAMIDGVGLQDEVVRLEQHSTELDPAAARARSALVHRLESGGFSPPLKKELDEDPALLRALVRAGDIVDIGDFYLTADQVERVRSLVRADINSTGGSTLAQLRDALGTTRKYAVPLAEWLDRSGFTRREGDLRVLGPKAD